MTWDPRLYFPSEGRRAEDSFALKNPTASAGFEPANLDTKGHEEGVCRNGPKGAHRRTKAECLATKQITVLEHPAYSPDLAPNDFFLFPKIKEIM